MLQVCVVSQSGRFCVTQMRSKNKEFCYNCKLLEVYENLPYAYHT